VDGNYHPDVAGRLWENQGSSNDSDTVALIAIVIFDASDGLFLAGGISAGEAEYSGGCPVAARNVQLPIS
jgi:hypothetical protein